MWSGGGGGGVVTTAWPGAGAGKKDSAVYIVGGRLTSNRPFRMSWNQDFQSILDKLNVQKEDGTLKKNFLLEKPPRQAL